MLLGSSQPSSQSCSCAWAFLRPNSHLWLACQALKAVQQDGLVALQLLQAGLQGGWWMVSGASMGCGQFTLKRSIGEAACTHKKVHVHVPAHTFTPTHTHAHAHAHPHRRTHTHKHIHTHPHTHTHTHTDAHIHTQTHIHAHTHMHTHTQHPTQPGMRHPRLTSSAPSWAPDVLALALPASCACSVTTCACSATTCACSSAHSSWHAASLAWVALLTWLCAAGCSSVCVCVCVCVRVCVCACVHVRVCVCVSPKPAYCAHGALAAPQSAAQIWLLPLADPCPLAVMAHLIGHYGVHHLHRGGRAGVCSLLGLLLAYFSATLGPGGLLPLVLHWLQTDYCSRVLPASGRLHAPSRRVQWSKAHCARKQQGPRAKAFDTDEQCRPPTFMARCAKVRVFSVSSMCCAEGLMVARMAVRDVPPRQGCRSSGCGRDERGGSWVVCGVLEVAGVQLWAVRPQATIG